MTTTDDRCTVCGVRFGNHHFLASHQFSTKTPQPYDMIWDDALAWWMVTAVGDKVAAQRMYNNDVVTHTFDIDALIWTERFGGAWLTKGDVGI